MTTKIWGSTGVEFSDATVQGSAAYDKVAGDARYVNVAGDTMTGNMVVEGGAAFIIKRDPALQAGYLGFHNMAGNLRAAFGYTAANESLGMYDNVNTNSYIIMAQSPADVYVAGSNRVKFVTGGTGRFDIVAQYIVTAGNTPTTYGNGMYLSNTGVMSLGFPSGTAVGAGYILFGLNGVSAGSVTLNTGNTVSFNTSSDYRLKDNIKDLTGSGAFIDALRPREWTWKVDGSKGVGFVAHEAQAVMPSAITGSKDQKKQKAKEDGTFEEVDEIQQMCYSSPELIGNIIAELKDLRQRVAALEGKNK
jgi:hypothetical protein